LTKTFLEARNTLGAIRDELSYLQLIKRHRDRMFTKRYDLSLEVSS